MHASGCSRNGVPATVDCLDGCRQIPEAERPEVLIRSKEDPVASGRQEVLAASVADPNPDPHVFGPPR
jgi:hypothetical protein